MNSSQTPAGQNPDRVETTADWPYASLLLLGFFGAHTPAGKRLVRETALALGLIIVSIILLRARLLPLAGLLGAVGLPVGVAAIGWAYSRYLGMLDELSRMIQLKALAFSYGVAMTLAAAFTGFGAVIAPRSLAVDPLAFLMVLVLAEPIRGLALVVLARKYR